MSKNFNKKFTDTEVRLGEVRFSYVYLFAPKPAGQVGAGKYAVMILIDKEDKDTYNMAKSAIDAAIEIGKVEKWKGKVPANLKNPLKDGDDYTGDADLSGYWYISASNSTKPGLRVMEGGQLVEALDTEDFYSGCYGAAVINFSPYNTDGNMGVGAYINNAVKTRDGEKLSGGRSAEASFSDLADLMS